MMILNTSNTLIVMLIVSNNVNNSNNEHNINDNHNAGPGEASERDKWCQH